MRTQKLVIGLGLAVSLAFSGASMADSLSDEFGPAVGAQTLSQERGREGLQILVEARVVETVNTDLADFGLGFEIDTRAGTHFVIPALKLPKEAEDENVYIPRLGGLNKSGSHNSSTPSQVPGLGDIPVLGALFRSTQTNTRTNLQIFVTPNLVPPTP
jgi:pilus assembly protein CpaC